MHFRGLNHRRRLNRALRFLAGSIALSAPLVATSTTYTWTGYGAVHLFSNNNWGTSYNWASSIFSQGTVPPTNSYSTDLVFSGPDYTSNFNNLGTFDLDSITFNNYSWNLSGGSFNFAGGGAINANSSAVVNQDILINANGSGANYLFANAAAGKSLSLNGTITGFEMAFNGLGTVNLGATNSNLYIAYVISGTVNSEAINAFGTEALDLQGGLVNLNGQSQTVTQFYGAGTLDVNGGTFTDNYAGSNQSFSGTIRSSASGGTFIKDGSGTVSLLGSTGGTAANLTYAVNNGVLQLGHDSAINGANLTLTGGTFDLSGHSDTVKNISLGDGSVVNIGSIVDSGASAGTLSLAGDLTLNGRTDHTSASSLISANLSLTSGNHYVKSGTATTNFYDIVDTGSITGTGGLTVDSSKDPNGLTLVIEGATSYAGDTVVQNRGYIAADSTNALSANSDFYVNSSGALILGVPSTQPNLVLGAFSQTIGALKSNLNGNGYIDLEEATLTVGANNHSGNFYGKFYSSNISGSPVHPGTLVKVGTGVQTLASTDTFTGNENLVVNSGTLALGANSVVHFQGGELGGNLTLTGGTFDLAGHSDSVNNITLGDGTATSIGTISDSGASKGTLTINGGVTLFGAKSLVTAPVTITANLGLSSGQHLFSVSQSDTSGYIDVIQAGTISGTGGITLNGVGDSYGGAKGYKTGFALALTGQATYSGDTLIQTGGLLRAGGTNVLSPNSDVYDESGGGLRLGIPYDQTNVVVGAYGNTIGALNGVTGNGYVALNDATLTIGANNHSGNFKGIIASSAIPGSVDPGTLIKAGTGIQTFSSTDMFSNSGYPPVSNVNLVAAGGTIALGANNVIDYVGGSLGGNLTLNGGAFDLAGFSDTVNNINLGDGFVTTIGTITDSGATPGALTLNGGVLLNGAKSNASGAVIFGENLVLSSGSHLFSVLQSSTIATYDLVDTGTVTGSGGLTIDGTGDNYGGGFVVALVGQASYSGLTDIKNKGWLRAGAVNSLSANSDVLIESGGTLRIATPIAQSGTVLGVYNNTIGALEGTVNGTGSVYLDQADLTVGANNHSGTFYGVVTSYYNLGTPRVASVIKTGTGTETFASSNTFDGNENLAVNNGTLALGSNNVLHYIAGQSGGNLTLNGGAFDLAGFSDTINNINLGDGSVVNIGSIVDSGASHGTLTLSGDITLNGRTDHSTAATLISANLNLTSGNHFVKSGTATTNFYDIVDTGTVTGSGGLTVDSSTDANALTLVIKGATSYSGDTVIQNRGYIDADSTNALSANSDFYVNSNSALILGVPSAQANLVKAPFSQTIGALNSNLNGNGYIDLKDATLTVGANNHSGTFYGLIVSNNISGSTVQPGTFVKVGTGVQTLASTNTFFSNINLSVNNGTLALGANYVMNAKPNQTGGDLILDGGTFDLNGHNEAFNNIVFGDGSVVNTGALTNSSSTYGAILLMKGIELDGRADHGTNPSTIGVDLNLAAGNHLVSLTPGGHTINLHDIVDLNAIFGNGGLTLNGTGDPGYTFGLVLKGPTTYTGATDIQNSANLYGNGTNVLSANSAFTVESGGTLQLGSSFLQPNVALGGFDNAIGSLSGSGLVELYGATLTLGGLNTDTVFSGKIVDQTGHGSIVKVGTGRTDFTAKGSLVGVTGSIDIVNGTLATTTKELKAPVSIETGGTLEIDQSFTGTLGDEYFQTENGNVLKTGVGTMNIDGLTIGGTFTVGAGTAALNGTTLEADSGITVNNGARLRLLSQDAGLVGGTLDNSGEVSGSGTVNNSLKNEAFGRVLLGSTDNLEFTGAGNHNAGTIGITGGSLSFTQDLTVDAGGSVSGRGTIQTGSTFTNGAYGLTNNGALAFSGGFSDVYGKVLNTGKGTVDNSGNSVLTFHDDVKQNGAAINTAAGSTTVFLGQESGSGSFTGTGTVDFEGVLNPGNSPASVHYGGNVILGANNTTIIQLGGLLPGSQYDQLVVNGTLYLGGTLDIELINGFAPRKGSQFDLFVGKESGSFSSILFPSSGYTLGSNGILTYGTAQAVPEPAPMLAVGLGGLLLLRRRKKAS